MLSKPFHFLLQARSVTVRQTTYVFYHLPTLVELGLVFDVLVVLVRAEEVTESLELLDLLFHFAFEFLLHGLRRRILELLLQAINYADTLKWYK